MKNVFGHFWQLFNNIWFFWPLHIGFRIQNIHFGSTKNAGSQFLGPKLHFSLFIFPNIRPELITPGQNFERLVGISNFRSEFWTFGRNLERSTRISNVRPDSRKFNQNLERSGPYSGHIWNHSKTSCGIYQWAHNFSRQMGSAGSRVIVLIFGSSDAMHLDMVSI